MKKRVESAKKKPAIRKALNVHNVDYDLWKRFREAAEAKGFRTYAYLEQALREKLERDGF